MLFPTLCRNACLGLELCYPFRCPDIQMTRVMTLLMTLSLTVYLLYLPTAVQLKTSSFRNQEIEPNATQAHPRIVERLEMASRNPFRTRQSDFFFLCSGNLLIALFFRRRLTFLCPLVPLRKWTLPSWPSFSKCRALEKSETSVQLIRSNYSAVIYEDRPFSTRVHTPTAHLWSSKGTIPTHLWQ